MVEAMKKSESDDESEEYATTELVWTQYIHLLKRIERLEAEFQAIQAGDNTGFKHPDDGGWFD